MIAIEEAIKIIENAVNATDEIERLPLHECFGRVLAVDVYSDINVPPFNRVTMDGYAVVSADGPGSYEVVEDVPAGVYPSVRVTSGKVSKVMTGAPMPEGADAVIQVEKTGGFADVGEIATINEPIASGKNVSPLGEDIREGDKVLDAPCVIRPPESAVLASMGIDPAPVYKQPTIAVLATGDELVPPAVNPGPGQIRNSNEYSTYAQSIAIGITPTTLGIARDDIGALKEKIDEGAQHDFLLISGGVSAGDRDFVPGILQEAGYDLLFNKVKIKPGKPVTFGVSDKGRFVFGMPGNPVSAMVIFELFIKPAVRKFTHLPRIGYRTAMAKLDADYKRRADKREEYVPVNVCWDGEGYLAQLIPFHGSGHFSALTKANGLAKIPIGTKEVAKGGVVEIRFFNDFTNR